MYNGRRNREQSCCYVHCTTVEEIGNRAVVTMAEEDREQSCCYNSRRRWGTQTVVMMAEQDRKPSFCYDGRIRQGTENVVTMVEAQLGTANQQFSFR